MGIGTLHLGAAGPEKNPAKHGNVLIPLHGGITIGAMRRRPGEGQFAGLPAISDHMAAVMQPPDNNIQKAADAQAEHENKNAVIN